MLTKGSRLLKTIKSYQKRFAFSSDQEKRFHQMIERKTSLLFLLIAVFVTLFQLYNIFYVLIYTDGRLHTVASRIYMLMYLVMLLFTFAVLVIRSVWFRKNTVPKERFTLLYGFYGGVLVFWSVCLTLYDQRVSDNLNVFLTVALSSAGLIYMKPAFSVTVYTLSELLFLVELPYFQQGGIQDHYGKYVNSICFALLALFVSLYRNYTLRQDFLNQETIANQTRKIEEQNKTLDYIANHDTLTGLGNRHCLDTYITDLTNSETPRRSAVLMIDIDFFKQYNDAFGHLKGDECLRTVAEFMEKFCSSGRLFRYGGEEFLCLMTDLAEWGDGYLAAIALCWGVEGLELPAANGQKNLTVSIGCTEGMIERPEDFMKLLNQADKALYSAKNTGRNRVVRYEDGPFVQTEESSI